MAVRQLWPRCTGGALVPIDTHWSLPCQRSGWLDANWEQEIGVRMPPGSHYIDFTASGLYTNGQLAAATQELATHVYGGCFVCLWVGG